MKGPPERRLMGTRTLLATFSAKKGVLNATKDRESFDWIKKPCSPRIDSLPDTEKLCEVLFLLLSVPSLIPKCKSQQQGNLQNLLIYSIWESVIIILILRMYSIVPNVSIIFLVCFRYKGKFILLSDAKSDGSFLIHHFLSMYIRGTVHCDI